MTISDLSAAPPARASRFQLTADAAARYERTVGTFMMPLTEHLIDRAGLREGDRVLDLACGTGFVARLAAARVGPGGSIVGVDVNPSMAAEARRVTGLQIVESSAAATGLPTGSFDLVLCQQGLQYVPEAAAAVAEAVRVLRPGGRLALSVWSGFDRNPFRAAQIRAMSAYLPAEAVAAFARTDVSALGGVEGVESLLRAAGLGAIHVAEHQLRVGLPPMVDFFPELMAATPWATHFARLAPAERREVIDRMEDVVVPDPDGPGGRVPMVIVGATATTR